MIILKDTKKQGFTLALEKMIIDSTVIATKAQEKDNMKMIMTNEIDSNSNNNVKTNTEIIQTLRPEVSSDE